MRSSAKYIWIFLVVAFVGGFLLYQTAGLAGQQKITPTTAVATVNGEDILYTDWQARTQQLEQQRSAATGQAVSLDEHRALEDQAYNQLVDDILLRQELRRRGISVSDDEITEAARTSPPPQVMQDPELQTNGQFDLTKYQRFLSSPTARQSGILLQLENYYRDAIPKEKLYEQLTAATWPWDGLLWMNYRDEHDSATVTYATMRPTPQDLAGVPVSDDEVRAFYDSHKAQLDRTGRAVVTVTQILRSVTAADSAAVREHATALRNRIVGGEKFEDVAKSESADSASAVRGGDLGEGPASRFVPAFAAAASALKVGEVSGPVLTPFGYHLIRLDSRKGDTLGLHHILLRIAQSDSAASRTDHLADSLSKLAANQTDHPERFDQAIRALGLRTAHANVQEGTPLVVNGAPVPSVSAWAFGGAKAHETSDLFSDDAGYYLARLESVQPGGTPSLSDAKDEIRRVVATKKALQRLVDPATKLATAAAASSLEQAAAVLHTPLQKAGAFTRISGAQQFPNAAQLVGAAFALPVGTVSAPIVGDDAVFVARVDSRHQANRADWEKSRAAQRSDVMTMMQRGRITEFMTNLRSSAKISDRRKDLQASLAHANS